MKFNRKVTHNFNSQGSQYVREKIVKFMNKLISLGAAGFRVDAAKHMWPSDLDQIYRSVDNLNPEFGFNNYTRPFIYQEVIDLGLSLSSLIYSPDN